MITANQRHWEPDGVRRRVAVSIIALMLALTGKLLIKDKLAREAAAGFARRGEHMGVGLLGRTLGSIGVGSIGAELFRLIKPFDIKLIAHATSSGATASHIATLAQILSTNASAPAPSAISP